MTKVFISYSRKDKDFAGRFTQALQQNQLETWIDWEDIPPTADWLDQIHKGIEQADGFLFLLSPDSVSSKVCAQEIEHAVQNGKRLIPIVVRNIDPKDVHPAVAKVNWIYAREQDDFIAAAVKTLSAIRTDLAWVEAHRRLQVRALEWWKRKDGSLLLRGKDLRQAEEQLASAGRKDPQPTDLQRQFVLESRRGESRTRNIFLAIGAMVIVCLVCATIISVASGFNATIQANAASTARVNAENHANIAATARVNAENERSIALSNGLSSEALRLQDQGELSRAFLLSVQANQFAETARSKNTLFMLLVRNRNMLASLNLPEDWQSGFRPEVRINSKGDKALVTVMSQGTDLYILWDLKTFKQLDLKLFPTQSPVSINSTNQLVLGEAGEPFDGFLDIYDNRSLFGLLEDRAQESQVIMNPQTKQPENTILATFCRSFKSSYDWCDGAAVYVFTSSEPYLQPQTFTLSGPDASVQRLDYDTSGSLFALVHIKDDEMQLWKYASTGPAVVETFNVTGYVPNPDDPYSLRVEYSAKTNSIIWITEANEIIVWDLVSKTVKYKQALNMKVSNLKVSPDGMKLAVALEDGIHLFTIENGLNPLAVTIPNKAPGAMAFSQNGQMLSVGLASKIEIWDTVSGEKITQIDLTSAAASEIHNMYISEDEKTIAVGLYTPIPIVDPIYTYLVDIGSGVETGPFIGGFDPILSPDNNLLTAAGFLGQGDVYSWNIDPKNWQAHACQIANRNLTQAEWKQYVGGMPYQITCPNFPEPSLTPQPVTISEETVTPAP